MPGKSQSHTDAVLNVLRNIPLSGVTPHVGLFSAAPANDAGAGTELSGGGYARQAVTFGAPTAGVGNVRQIANTNTITFGPATVDWPQAVAFGIFTAVTEGTLLYWDALAAPRTILTNDSAQFAAGNLIVKED
jgi:hypothetical protein